LSAQHSMQFFGEREWLLVFAIEYLRNNPVATAARF
jgi:hypothetical protein